MAGSLEMITSAADFAALQAGGRSRVHPLVILRFRANQLGRTRYAISTARRLGNAVVRNRIRRRLREILRGDRLHIGSGWDVLIVARGPAAAASQADLAEAIERLVSSSPLRAAAPST
jgi:ribonuclease P protein component